MLGAGVCSQSSAGARWRICCMKLTAFIAWPSVSFPVSFFLPAWPRSPHPSFAPVNPAWRHDNHKQGLCAPPEAAFFCLFSPSLPFCSSSPSLFYIKYLLGLQLIKYHFTKSCFHLSKMAVRLKLFDCIRSQENIKKNPFGEWNNTTHFSSVSLVFLLMAL